MERGRFKGVTWEHKLHSFSGNVKETRRICVLMTLLWDFTALLFFYCILIRSVLLFIYNYVLYSFCLLMFCFCRNNVVILLTKDSNNNISVVIFMTSLFFNAEFMNGMIQTKLGSEWIYMIELSFSRPIINLFKACYFLLA